MITVMFSFIIARTLAGDLKFLNFFILELTGITDYVSVVRSLDFNPDVTSLEIPIPIVPNDAIEPTENFFAVLNVTSPDSENIILGRSTAHITIEDDDCKQIHFIHVGGVPILCAFHSCYNRDSGGEYECDRRWS